MLTSVRTPEYFFSIRRTQATSSLKIREKIETNEQNTRPTRQDQILASRITIFPIPDAYMPVKNTINDSQDNLLSLDPSNTTTAGPEFSNVTEAKGKNFKTAFINA